jgi:hypothetical protein
MTDKTIIKEIYLGMQSLDYGESSDTTSESKYNKIIASCLIFYIIKNLIATDSSNESNIVTLAGNYGTTYKSIVSGMKNTYISYLLMQNKLAEYKPASFLDMTNEKIETIYKLYQNKTEIKKFSCINFSEYMYNVSSISADNEIKLRKIHFDVMVPIMKFYKATNGLNDNNMVIIQADTGGYIGKEIIFYIDGVSNANLIYDIKNKIYTNDRIYSVVLYYNYIKITLK